MKSIKEKQLLVKWARAMNEPVDTALAEEVDRYNQLQQDIIESVKRNTINDLSDASKVAVDIIKKVAVDYPKPPTYEELLGIIEEETNELVQAQATQAPPVAEEKTQPVSTGGEVVKEDLISRAVEHIHKEIKLEENSFQQPNPPLVDKNIEAIQKKLKFLEQAISKIAATGPGSGEVRFLRLDDVNYSSWQDRDRHKILKYEPNNNPAYDGVTFGFLTGDQGPVDSIKFQETGYTANANIGPGLVAWNSTEDCLDIHQSNGTVLQTGLEHYVRVHNTNVNTIYQGNVVYFTGADNDGNPTGHIFIANSTCQPRLIIGIATEDIIVGNTGRVTNFGKVRTLNTTGAPFGETWYQGNIVYAHPVIPGGLTVNEPVAPNVSISLGIVTVVDASNGIILVDVEKKERANYGNFANTKSFNFAVANTPYPIYFDKTMVSSGIYVPSGNTSHLVANAAGLYNFQFSTQYTTSSGTKEEVYIWIKKNGVNVEDSGTQVSITGNNTDSVAAWNFVEPLRAGDYLEMYHAVSSTVISALGGSQVAFMPNIPSVLMSVTQVS